MRADTSHDDNAAVVNNSADLLTRVHNNAEAKTPFLLVGIFLQGEYRVIVVRNEWPVFPLIPVYRGDKRDPDIIFRQGFTVWGMNTNLFSHAMGETIYADLRSSAFISTSEMFVVAKAYAKSRRSTKRGWVYVINPQIGAIDVNRVLGSRYLFRYERQIAIPFKVKNSDIKGAYSPYEKRYVPNLQYVAPLTSVLPFSEKVYNALKTQEDNGVVVRGLIIDAIKDFDIFHSSFERNRNYKLMSLFGIPVICDVIPVENPYSLSPFQRSQDFPAYFPEQTQPKQPIKLSTRFASLFMSEAAASTKPILPVSLMQSADDQSAEPSLRSRVFWKRGPDIRFSSWYRGDGRAFSEIFFKGFTARGTNMNLLAHVLEQKGDSGFVGTSKSKLVARTFAYPVKTYVRGENALCAWQIDEYHVYEVIPQRTAEHVPKALDHAIRNGVLREEAQIADAKAFAQEIEMAARHGIKKEDIRGVHVTKKVRMDFNPSPMVSEKFIPNPNYVPPFAVATKVLKRVGSRLLVVSVAFDVAELYETYKRSQSTDNFELFKDKVGEKIGGWAGAFAVGSVAARAGAAAGAAIGSLGAGVFAVPGAFIGGTVSGIVGTVVGYYSGGLITKKARSQKIQGAFDPVHLTELTELQKQQWQLPAAVSNETLEIDTKRSAIRRTPVPDAPKPPRFSASFQYSVGPNGISVGLKFSDNKNNFDYGGDFGFDPTGLVLDFANGKNIVYESYKAYGKNYFLEIRSVPGHIQEIEIKLYDSAWDKLHKKLMLLPWTFNPNNAENKERINEHIAEFVDEFRSRTFASDKAKLYSELDVLLAFDTLDLEKADLKCKEFLERYANYNGPQKVQDIRKNKKNKNFKPKIHFVAEELTARFERAIGEANGIAQEQLEQYNQNLKRYQNFVDLIDQVNAAESVEQKELCIKAFENKHPDHATFSDDLANLRLQIANQNPEVIDSANTSEPLRHMPDEVRIAQDRQAKVNKFGVDLAAHVLRSYENNINPFMYALANYGLGSLALRSATGFLHPFLSEQKFQQAKQIAHTADTAYNGYCTLSALWQLYSNPSWIASYNFGSGLLPFAIDPLHQHYENRYAMGDAPETYLGTAAEDVIRFVHNPHVNFVWQHKEVIGSFAVPTLISVFGYIPDPTVIALVTLIALIKVNSDQNHNIIHNAQHALLGSLANPSQFREAESKLSAELNKLFSKYTLDLKQHGPIIAALLEHNDKYNDALIETFCMHTVESRLYAKGICHIGKDGTIFIAHKETVSEESALIELSIQKGAVRIGFPKKKSAPSNLSEHYKIIDFPAKHTLETLKKLSEQLELMRKLAEEKNKLKAKSTDYSISQVDPADKYSLSTLGKFSETNRVGLTAEQKLTKYCNKLSSIIDRRERALQRNPLYIFSTRVVALATKAVAYNAAVESMMRANRSSFWSNASSPLNALPARQAARDLLVKPLSEYFTEDARYKYYA